MHQDHPKSVTRRRSLQILAATGLTAAFAGAIGSSAATHLPSQDLEKVSWQGLVLGAQADLTFYVTDQKAGEALLAQLLQEVERLEQIFSLYRADSAVTRLNQQGWLTDPPQELVTLLARSQRFSQQTRGAFDVTVQPLWHLLAKSDAMPTAAALAQAQALVDNQAISLSAQRIAFDRPGMAITLNGIAQGYITDRIALQLKQAGMTSVLVNLGEARALDAPPHKGAWQVGLQDPDAPDKLLGQISLTNRSLATSAPASAQTRLPNLLDPRQAEAPKLYRSLTVLADDATSADALSTGFSALTPAEIKGQLSQLKNVEVLLYPKTGGSLRLAST